MIGEDGPSPFDEFLMNDEEGNSIWPSLRFELMWIEHGGSGLNMRLADIEDLDIGDALELIQLMRQQKKKEADAIKRAHQR